MPKNIPNPPKATPFVPIDLDRVQKALAHSAIGHSIHYYHSIASTMPIAHALAATQSKSAGTVSGTLIVAEEQTAGRGRLERSWQAAVGSSLLCSLLLKADRLPSQPETIMMIAGVALHDTLNTFLPSLSGRCGLKWPNDLLLGDEKPAAKKVAGILIESRFQGNHLDHAVIGFGINVNQSEGELPALVKGALPPTSIFSFTGESIDRTALLIEIAQRWESLLEQSIHDSTSIYQKWRNALWTLGEKVIISNQGVAVCAGIAIDVDRSGALLVQDNTGLIHTIHAGDVSLRAV